MKMKLHAELISTWMVSRGDSFWYRGKRHLENNLFVIAKKNCGILGRGCAVADLRVGVIGQASKFCWNNG